VPHSRGLRAEPPLARPFSGRAALLTQEDSASSQPSLFPDASS
jgi:hypothetical protein